jgi:hypothetical protein
MKAPPPALIGLRLALGPAMILGALFLGLLLFAAFAALLDSAPSAKFINPRTGLFARTQKRLADRNAIKSSSNAPAQYPEIPARP